MRLRCRPFFSVARRIFLGPSFMRPRTGFFGRTGVASRGATTIERSFAMSVRFWVFTWDS